ncbi:MAG TPA: lipopolysaccharide heptosyltransferase II [Vicinamibacteria bacterium]|nr:lipopolysaccharide heptosyltransferase II [Vicinamibacteria bacterium]
MNPGLARRILVRAPNWLGDAVLGLAAVRDVRRSDAQAHLSVLARPSVAPLYGALPEVDTVLESAGLRADARALKEGGFDLGILLPNSFGSALALRMGGVRQRWGWATDGRAALLTRAARVPRELRGRNQLYYYRAMLAAMGLDVSAPPDTSLSLPPAWTERAAELLGASGEAWIALAPGAHFGGAKRWLPERFAAVAARLAAGLDAGVALLGTASERPLAERIAALLDGRVADLCGRTTLAEMAGVLAQARLLLSNDSGAMHVAAALGTPVVAVFGPTDWRETAPVGDRHRLVREPVHCSPCLLRECPIDHRCMRRVTAERVEQAARELLAGEGAAARA